MAEAAGLALGGIALASLITTCVEFITYFEDGRDCIRDFSLAVTKVRLMQARLKQLGNFENSVKELYGLDDGMGIARHDWHHVAAALPDGYLGIREIIARATKLCSRYSQGRASLAHKCAQIAAQSSRDLVMDSHMDTPAPCRRSVLHRVITNIYWALHDKRVLSNLIAEFDFILSNLEIIIGHFNANKQRYRETLNMDKHHCNTSEQEAQYTPKEGDHRALVQMNQSTLHNGEQRASEAKDQHASEERGREQGRRPDTTADVASSFSGVHETHETNIVTGQGIQIVGGDVQTVNKSERLHIIQTRDNQVDGQSIQVTGIKSEAIAQTAQKALQVWGTTNSQARHR